MIEKKYTIFVSSTFTDLIEERRIVREAIVAAGHIPIGMEYFTPGNQEQMEFIKPLIDKSDFFILIVGGRYGSINKDTKKSYTEMEYDYAIKQGAPVASFLLTDEAIENLPFKHAETSKRNRKLLGEFRTKVRNKMCRDFSNKEELRCWIHLTIENLIKNNERPGWIRSINED